MLFTVYTLYIENNCVDKKYLIMLSLILIWILPISCYKPLIITSNKFIDHIPSKFDHPERPERIQESLVIIEDMLQKSTIQLAEPSGHRDESRRELALEIIKSVHDTDYVNEVRDLCLKGARMLSPWDEDTYISRHSFDVCLLAQSAWLDAIDVALNSKQMTFAVTRPPG